MAEAVRWWFYQGLRDEWHWYELDETGQVIRASDRGFQELDGCMSNAEDAGFERQRFRVHTRNSGDAEFGGRTGWARPSRAGVDSNGGASR